MLGLLFAAQEAMRLALALLFCFCVCLCLPFPLMAKSDAWLLMRPPASGTTEPISSWVQVEAFDSAEACASKKVAFRELLSDRAIDSDLEEAVFQKILDTLYAARCVPAELVYGSPKKRDKPKNNLAKPI